MRQTAYKWRELFQDIICRHEYAERVVASFSNKIESEYYVVNISMSLEVNALEQFSAVTKTNINSTTTSRQCYEVFHSFLSDGRK